MDTLVKFNEQLYGAPVGVLIALFAIALGYLLKSIPAFPNPYIPLAVVTFCTVLFMLSAPMTPDTVMRVWLVRNFLIGFVIGFGAWGFHAQILKRWIDKKDL